MSYFNPKSEFPGTHRTETMRSTTRRYGRFVTLKNIVILFGIVLVINLSGIHLKLFEKDFSSFAYPLDTPDFQRIVEKFRNNADNIQPSNTYYSSIPLEVKSDDDCHEYFYFLLLVKSSPQNRQNRDAIRKTWMQFSNHDIPIKTVFFLGKTEGIEEEIQTYQDIAVIDFVDSYYNNTIKTMVEMRWAVEHCSNFEYALLVDDDYFVSVKNLYEFTKQNQIQDQDRLYAGFSMFPRPLRHKIFNKWFVSLSEYPYNRFPPYITAGAILLSKSALLDIHFASFFIKPFRFDDIYVAICAKKMNINVTHSDNFRFWEQSGENPEKDLIVSHGYRNPERLIEFWTVQSQHGYV